MAAFEFLALDEQGRQKKGVLEADSSRQARQLLRERQLVPLDVKPATIRAANKPSLFSRGLSAAELALVTRQLATLIQASLPVEEALRAAAAQSKERRIKSILLAIRSRVLEGHGLAASLAEYRSSFPDLFRATVAAGEHAGHLGTVLEQLADYTEQQQASRQRIQMALVYPSILVCVSILIIGFLLGSVVPDIVKVFVNTKQELPWLTRALLCLSEIVRTYGVLIAFFLSLLFLGGRALLKKEKVRHEFHGVMLKLPLVGGLIRAVNTARFASTLSILSRSGVPLVEALAIAAEVIGNVRIRGRVIQASQKVREGGSLTRALEATEEFPPMMMHMIASGERSGDLDGMLARSALNQENDLKTKFTMLVGLFEPFMLIFMGGVVLLIVLAILQPILSLNQLVG
ncbi:type II secretion system inner membrane protein GspF [Pseudomonas sp. EpS/L25]|uniref:type II secretion system inner membrane protein GspF n=1 Tax=Pseudomonas sp. EpS/L25 TaxID=1749078 RepID=UPI0007437273|nr:type II secretion system inner membrane protein GspF [Pseudomonas sp. EpS/L25]KUM41943.1 type II secretion system protein GspF [Pseudomonas sp. EpS/L25]